MVNSTVSVSSPRGWGLRRSGLFGTARVLILSGVVPGSYRRGAAGLPGVHGDEHVARELEADLRALEVEALRVRGDGALNGQDLLRDDAQHLP
eukprot:1194250-Prorocentrum_minimum.AAC.2